MTGGDRDSSFQHDLQFKSLSNVTKKFNTEQLASQTKMVTTLEVFLNIAIRSTLEGQCMMQNSNIRYNKVTRKVATLSTTAN